MPFIDSLDVANRSIQILGGEAVLSPTEDSSRNTELSFAYDKLRRPELRRNVWRFAIKTCALRAVVAAQPATGATAATNPTMLLVPPLYNSAEEYTVGSIVVDTNNIAWISMQEENTGNLPGGNNELWEAYFGQMTVQPYDTTGGTAYYSGELVYVMQPAGSAPLYTVFMSLSNSNADVPNVATPWSATTTYYGGQIVSFGGSQWISNIELNLNQSPVAAPASWVATTSYTTGNQVTASDGFVYQALGITIGNNPAFNASPTFWTNTLVLGAWSLAPNQSPVSDVNWAIIPNGQMKNLIFSYPIGSGPSNQSTTRNVFHLPAGYLRQANQDPKAGQNTIFGSPTGRINNDWTFSGNFLVSQDPGPIIFRFVADVVKVRDFDDLFAEGLASRMGYECCEKLTGSTDKQRLAQQNYTKAIGEARAVNAIEIGAETAPEDDWITCRL